MRIQQMILGVALCGACAGSLAAEPPGPLTRREQVARAELIFAGTVERVQYVQAVQNGEEPSDTYTFVTFQVERIFKGNVSGNRLTLRFFGGVGADGLLLGSSVGTRWDVGERSLLFVRGNGTAKCPLVGWSGGRFRLVNGAVYTERGSDLVLTGPESLRSGTQRDLDEVALFQWGENGPVVRMGPVPWDLREPTPAGDSGAETAKPAPVETQAATEAAFGDWLAALVARVHAPAELAILPAVASLDASAPLVVPARKPIRLTDQ